MRIDRAIASIALAAACGCAAVAPPIAPPPTQSEWSAARERLDALRRSVSTSPWVEQVTISFREPGTGKLFEGRGAIAVLPKKAMRMILVGPGGTTALDAWVTPDAYRFAIPPVGLVRRGGKVAEAALPIDFFRWWFLARYDGRLRTIVGRDFVLDDGSGVVSIDDRIEAGERTVVARRRHGSIVELLGFRGRADGKLGKGDHASYRNVTSGLTVEVTVDEVGSAPPDPDAFTDPDAVGDR